MHIQDTHVPAVRTSGSEALPSSFVRPTPSTLVTWARVQAASGLVFGVFALLHLANTVLGMFGSGVYNGFQRAVRPVYQYPAVELGLIVVPLLVHMTAAIVRMRRRRGSRAPASLRLRLHRYAGYFLLTFMLGHMGATRLPSLLYGAWPEFEGVAYSFQMLPQWFYIYYPLLGMAGLVHVTVGLPVALGTLGVAIPKRYVSGRALWVPLSVHASLLLLGLAGLGGLLFDVPDFSSHPFAVGLSRLAALLIP